MRYNMWIQKGFKVILRGRWVYLVKPGGKIFHAIEKNNGSWMNFDDLNSPPWRRIEIRQLHPDRREDIMAALRSCYCSNTGAEHCDFCTGLRKPSIWVEPLDTMDTSARRHTNISLDTF